ncbi:HisA/HisF-related TIM barrel protein [Candidatus Pelagibacter sp.]|nr:HisA/HisF-related TIM barrel protein [Candidatus Pelagibacter sp.]
MLKKRIIFTLLYQDGFFYHSRNFRLQKVGDVNWLKKNYNFENISLFIDELIILDVSRNSRDINKFVKDFNKITENCFVPVTIGGGITKYEIAKFFLGNGADKIMINSEIHFNPKILKHISETFGHQSIIVGIDLKKVDSDYKIFIKNGSEQINKSLNSYLIKILKLQYGEIFINSIDKDGTGTGLDLNILNQIPKNFNKPIIFSGGCGNFKHFMDGLKKEKISAISTSNLLNFIGDGLKKSRLNLEKSKHNFPKWNQDIIKNVFNFFNK